jgi:hypothetical protein
MGCRIGDREQRARSLFGRVQSDAPEVETEVFIDDGSLGVVENAFRCWDWASARSDVSIVLQDDVVPCDGWWPHVQAISEVIPDQPVGFMEWTRHSDEAWDCRYKWVESRANMHGCACMMPSHVASDALSWIRGRFSSPRWIGAHDDSLLCAYFMTHGLTVMHPVPTLFQHDLPAESSIGHSNKNRVCRVFGVEGMSTVRWSDLRRVKNQSTLAPMKWIRENFDVE